MDQLPIIILTLIVLLLLIALFKNLAPISKLPFQTNKTMEQLKRKYDNFELLIVGFSFLLIVVLTFIYFNVFVWLTDFRVSLLDNVVIIAKPYVGAWLIGSMFTAVLTALILVTYIGKRKLKGDWSEYAAYNNLKYGYYYEIIVRAVIKVYAVITAVLVIGFFDWFTAFRQEDIVVSNLFGLGNRIYKYSDIADIRDVQKTKALSGNIVDKKHYVIVFNDGTKWNSRDSGFDNFDKDTKIMEIVKQKTAKNLTELEFDNN